MSCWHLLAAGDDLSDRHVRELHPARGEVGADLVWAEAIGVQLADAAQLALLLGHRHQLENGHDAEAVIWSANGHRRHITKGQRAMIAAERFVAKQRGDQTLAAKSAGVSKARLSFALLVLEHAPHLVQDVIDGVPKMTLDYAYAQAQENKRQHDRLHDGLNTLRQQDPDLAQKVADREMTADTVATAYFTSSSTRRRSSSSSRINRGTPTPRRPAAST